MKKKELLRRIEVLEKRYATEEEKALLEPKKELEIGRWYFVDRNKYESSSFKKSLVLFQGQGIETYGWDHSGVYTECYGSLDTFQNKEYIYTEATPQEVEKALIEEAKRRYKAGDKLTRLNDFYYGGGDDIYSDKFEGKIFSYAKNSLCVETTNGYKHLIFSNGKWADVIKNDDKPQVGDVCKFWDNDESEFIIDVLNSTDCTSHPYNTRNGLSSISAKKLTEQEVIDLLFKK